MLSLNVVEHAKQIILQHRDVEKVPFEFREIQKNLTFEERHAIRSDRQIANKIFQIDFHPIADNQYYYWDNTTLSVWEYLRSFVTSLKPNAKLHELGCGPHATLSIALKQMFSALEISASDISDVRVGFAKKTAELNGIKIELSGSDMFTDVSDTFDLAFMNPPYVTTKKQTEISGEGLSVAAEWASGFAGDDGTDIIVKFLDGALKTQNTQAFYALGINNYFVPDSLLRELFYAKGFEVMETFKSQSDCTPNGVFPQVYMLQQR